MGANAKDLLGTIQRLFFSPFCPTGWQCNLDGKFTAEANTAGDGKVGRYSLLTSGEHSGQWRLGIAGPDHHRKRHDQSMGTRTLGVTSFPPTSGQEDSTLPEFGGASRPSKSGQWTPTITPWHQPNPAPANQCISGPGGNASNEYRLFSNGQDNCRDGQPAMV